MASREVGADGSNYVALNRGMLMAKAERNQNSQIQIQTQVLNIKYSKYALCKVIKLLRKIF